VRFPPPFVYVAAFGAAWWLNLRIEFLIDGAGAGTRQSVVGVALLACGLVCMVAGLATFVQARTAVIPHRPARQLVTWGPYRWSRNPMYVGLTIAYIGLSVVLNLAWPLVMLPLALVAMFFIIRREERYLGAAFGDTYADYCQRVRRWV
jgi:protein-S-isoprenylcysteine O-methyltransferase Ste14